MLSLLVLVSNFFRLLHRHIKFGWVVVKNQAISQFSEGKDLCLVIISQEILLLLIQALQVELVSQCCILSRLFGAQAMLHQKAMGLFLVFALEILVHVLYSILSLNLFLQGSFFLFLLPFSLCHSGHGFRAILSN